MADHQFIKHPLPPLFDSASRILILGSFPSVKTREQGFFYGHPQNRFWPVLSAVLGVDPPLVVTEPGRARRVLRERGVAMWDSIASCEIAGSSDSSIRHVVPTDLSVIFSSAVIRHVFCNGAASYRYFMKYQTVPPHIGVSKMPSTSPANAAHSLIDLIRAWQVILDYLD
ncbi:MAG TPA: DNA-deoxyinosine glycosylase [Bacillota bacterium]|nr:DNA-deoxyinosine glycosylase [Bacillota bacterium]